MPAPLRCAKRGCGRPDMLAPVRFGGGLGAVLVAVMLVSMGCGGDESASTSGSKQKPAKQKHEAPKKPGPEACLIRGGVSDVNRTANDLWVGLRDEGGGGFACVCFPPRPRRLRRSRTLWILTPRLPGAMPS